MLTDVRTWAQSFGGGRLALMRSGILSSACRGRSARCLRTFRRGARPFGAVARCARASCRAVAVVALSDAYGRSDVGATIRGGGFCCARYLVGRLPWWLCSMLTDVRTWGATIRGGGGSMRSGHLVEWLPWLCCAPF